MRLKVISIKAKSLIYDTGTHKKPSIGIDFYLETTSQKLAYINLKANKHGIAVFTCYGLHNYEIGSGYGKMVIKDGFRFAYTEAKKRNIDPKWAYIYYTVGSYDDIKDLIPLNQALLKLGFSKKIRSNDPYKKSIIQLTKQYPDKQNTLPFGYWKMPMSQLLKLQ